MSEAGHAAVDALIGLYVLLLLASTATTARRWMRFRRHRERPPRLLFRDFILLISHALPLVLIMVMRATIGLLAIGDAWIALVIPPLIGIAIYLFYEIFVIAV